MKISRESKYKQSRDMIVSSCSDLVCSLSRDNNNKRSVNVNVNVDIDVNVSAYADVDADVDGSSACTSERRSEFKAEA